MDDLNKRKRKKLLIIMSAVIALLMCLTVLLIIFATKKSYKLDDSLFPQVVAYNDEVDYSRLKIVNKKNKKKINVTQAMVLSCDPTDSLGTKKQQSGC